MEAKVSEKYQTQFARYVQLRQTLAFRRIHHFLDISYTTLERFESGEKRRNCFLSSYLLSFRNHNECRDFTGINDFTLRSILSEKSQQRFENFSFHEISASPANFLSFHETCRVSTF